MKLRPLRNGLLVRLLAGSVLIAVCSITATAWLAAQTTSGTIRREQGEAAATDARIYDALMGYGATHPTWNGVQLAVEDLVTKTGRRIAVTTVDRRRLAEAPAGTMPTLPSKASAVVDPLSVEAGLATDTSAGLVDPRAVGPFLLPAADRDRLATQAKEVETCLKAAGTSAEVRFAPNGRSWVLGLAPDPALLRGCSTAALNRMTSTESTALAELNTLVDACLQRARHEPVRVWLDPSGKFGTVPVGPAALGADSPAASTCLDTARQQQLRPYVAPAALLFVGDPVGAQTSPRGLSGPGTPQVVGVALLVLVVTVGITVVLSTRLVRPIRALTAAARRMQDGDRASRMTVKSTGEVALLAEAFNAMSANLQRTEDQRKALMSDVSHELRTPLSNIRGYLESAQDGVSQLDPALVTSLLEETLLLQHLVEDLQDLALAEAGALRLYPEPLAVADLLDQVAAAHQARAQAAGITLTTQVDGDPGLTADPMRLRQAVGNLVSNALRHTPAGGSVRLTARSEQDHVVVEVADTGTGIGPDDLPHVFDRFWRADKSRNRRSGGSGLGLAIVRNLVQAHSGVATVASTPGAGTVFTLRLPSC